MLRHLQYYIRKDGWVMGTILPLSVLLVNYLIFGDPYFDSPSLVAKTFLISFSLCFLHWFVLTFVDRQMRIWYPLHSQTAKRMVIYLLLHFVFVAAVFALVFIIYDLCNFFDQVKFTRFKWIVLIATIVFAVIMNTSLGEGITFYERWKKAKAEAEELRQENFNAQLDSLKSQINPHFLFNSLNTLCSLINENPANAEKFLLKLSKVYRYLLISGEGDLATLSSEIQFIQSYFHLLKTRYGESVSLTIQIDEQYLSYKLPSLTLQILVENAVKHNIMEKERPLEIIIATTDNGRLTIRNNLQRKTRGVSSNKVGLSNIGKRYKLLKQDDIEVKEDSKHFSVSVPLINSSQ
jgi:sensor histidine kinase YesM